MALFEKVVVFVSVLGSFFLITNSLPDVQVDVTECSPFVVDETGDAEHAIDDVIDNLLSNTQHNGYSYAYDEDIAEDHSYGHAACKGDISNDDCSRCLMLAKDYLIGTCAFRAGGHMKLHDCLMRYEMYEFSNEY